MDVPASILKHLKPLGHELALWREAITLLHGRLAKNRLPVDLAQFLTGWLPASLPDPLPAEFDVTLGQTESGVLRLQSSSVTFAADPAWRALLQLPGLKNRWIADLRAQHYEHLLALSHGAWPVIHAPLPPGAVIPGLNIPGWQHPPASLAYHSLNADRTIAVETPSFVQHWRAAYVKDQNGIHLQSASHS